MIIELLFNLILGLAEFLLSLIPDIQFDFALPDTTFVRQAFGLADYFFPIGTMLAAIGVIILIQNIQFVLKIFNFIWKKIPFIGG